MPHKFHLLPYLRGGGVVPQVGVLVAGSLGQKVFPTHVAQVGDVELHAHVDQ